MDAVVRVAGYMNLLFIPVLLCWFLALARLWVLAVATSSLDVTPKDEAS